MATAKCTTQTAVEFVHGYQGRDEPAPRKCGKDIHTSLAAYFRTHNAKHAMKVLEAEYKEFAEQNVPPGDRLSWGNVEVIMGEYYRTHGIDKFPFEPVEGSAETAITAMLTDEVELWCMLDLLTREKQVGMLYPLDHKTTGKITSWWTKQFRLGSQFTGYTWAAAKKTGEVVPGMYVNAIEIGLLPQSKNKCRTHGVPYPECKQYHTKWELLVTTRSPEAINAWLQDARALAKRFQMIQQGFGGSMELVQYAPQEGKFNGSCTFCQFRDFCDAGRRPELVNQMLVHAPWEPWNQ